MRNNIYKIIFLLTIFFFQVSEVLAGPGGKIAKKMFDTPAGRIIMLILVIIFLPLIIYVQTKEYFGIKKTRKDLRELGLKHPKIFDEILLKNRITDVFTRVHSAWSQQDLSKCKDFISEWYLLNQQTQFLDKWKDSNVENICNVRSINKIKPLHLRVSEEDNFEDSRIMMRVDANMEDYLFDKDYNKVVEGKKGYDDVTTVWTLAMHDGKWKVDNIEQEEVTLLYAKMPNIIPASLQAAYA